jgi:hypothetical protein
VHTIGTAQLISGLAVGVGRLIRLQCGCSEEYDTHGTGLPVLEFALGGRWYFLPSMHVGIEGRYAAMFNAESAGGTCCGPPIPQKGLTVSSIQLAVMLGASL